MIGKEGPSGVNLIIIESTYILEKQITILKKEGKNTNKIEGQMMKGGQQLGNRKKRRRKLKYVSHFYFTNTKTTCQ